MMAPTHVLAGLAIAAGVATVAPSLGTAAVVGGLLGGFVPDLDLFVGHHRKTLHTPVLGAALAVLAAVVALAAPTPVTVGLAVGLAAAAVHAASDVLGAGEELRPWERTNPHAVYCHATGRWLRARYVVPYDGAPRDVLLATVLAVPVVVTFDGPIRWLAVALVLAGGAYALVRKRVPEYVASLVE